MTECLRPGSDQSCSPDSEPTLEANGVGPLGGPRTDGQKVTLAHPVTGVLCSFRYTVAFGGVPTLWHGA